MASPLARAVRQRWCHTRQPLAIYALRGVVQAVASKGTPHEV
jgi:hypothetical protein